MQKCDYWGLYHESQVYSVFCFVCFLFVCCCFLGVRGGGGGGLFVSVFCFGVCDQATLRLIMNHECRAIN